MPPNWLRSRIFCVPIGPTKQVLRCDDAIQLAGPVNYLHHIFFCDDASQLAEILDQLLSYWSSVEAQPLNSSITILSKENIIKWLKIKFSSDNFMLMMAS